MQAAASVSQVSYPDQRRAGVFNAEFLNPVQSADTQVVIADGYLDGDVLLVEDLGEEIGESAGPGAIGAGIATISIQFPAGAAEQGGGLLQQASLG